MVTFLQKSTLTLNQTPSNTSIDQAHDQEKTLLSKSIKKLKAATFYHDQNQAQALKTALTTPTPTL